ncbi:tRNA 2-thiouridine(34) synthase MnmA [Elusimicrobiota bacterium]
MKFELFYKKWYNKPVNKKVMVAMSGGVDSSVAALLLKKQGYEVVGVTMCLGIKDIEDSPYRCCGTQSIEDARSVCTQLKIKHYVMDFSKQLEEDVINPFVADYSVGKTPNPCIECNRHIKFGSLFEKAKSMGFEFLATGHFAAIENLKGSHFLKKPKDKMKDQTYFLYQIKAECLKSVIFPLCDLTKDEVRGIARDWKLAVADKPQSQDVCFIPDKNYHKFIEKKIKSAKPGKIVDKKGSTLGNHKGICFYTVGQRAGFELKKQSPSQKPLYVVSINLEKNELVVGEKKDLGADGLIASDINLFTEDFSGEIFAKIRYAHKDAKCSVVKTGDKIRVKFDTLQQSITPGQSVVLYRDGFVLGGGKIESVI